MLRLQQRAYSSCLSMAALGSAAPRLLLWLLQATPAQAVATLANAAASNAMRSGKGLRDKLPLRGIVRIHAGRGSARAFARRHGRLAGAMYWPLGRNTKCDVA